MSSLHKHPTALTLCRYPQPQPQPLTYFWKGLRRVCVFQATLTINARPWLTPPILFRFYAPLFGRFFPMRQKFIAPAPALSTPGSTNCPHLTKTFDLNCPLFPWTYRPSQSICGLTLLKNAFPKTFFFGPSTTPPIPAVLCLTRSLHEMPSISATSMANWMRAPVVLQSATRIPSGPAE